MSHLAEEYAKSCGVKIGKPVLNPHYFPVLHDKYITIHNDKKVQAKEYDMWPDVIELIRPFLGEIKIIQIGAFGEPTIFGVDSHIPTNSLKQSSYIIKNSLAHVGIDSVPVHIASAFDKPVVGIYAHTYANTCCPLWNDKSKFITIESDRGGNKPSFSLEEHPKTINFIKPEKIAQAVLDVLGIEEKINHKTIFIGNNYTSKFLEVIPISEPRLIPSPIDVRMDIAHNEQNLSFIVRDYEVEVTLSKPIDKKFLACGRIKKIAYKTDRFDPEFCDLMKAHAIPHALICTSPETLSEEREKNFDLLINYLNEEEIILNNKKRIKVDDFSKIKIKSGKTVVSGQQAYETFFDLNDRKNLDHFYLDLDYFRVYTEEDE
tara:strand:+ start:1706 stop:2830 length:1125 start_codon:yes stop_codon:yes gene_type:complete